MSKLFAESFGTFWLVFGGCGSALFAAGVADVGIGYVRGIAGLKTEYDESRLFERTQNNAASVDAGFAHPIRARTLSRHRSRAAPSVRPTKGN